MQLVMIYMMQAADMMQETASVTEVNLNVEDITEEENVSSV